MSAVHYLHRGWYEVPKRVDPLAERAAVLWPDSPRNQAEWVRAVTNVRLTTRGWLLDRKQPEVA